MGKKLSALCEGNGLFQYTQSLLRVDDCRRLHGFTPENSDCQSTLRHQPDAAARDRSIVWRTSDRTSTTTGPFADIASGTISAACAAFVIV
jgi:hypothetical protein